MSTRRPWLLRFALVPVLLAIGFAWMGQQRAREEKERRELREREQVAAVTRALAEPITRTFDPGTIGSNAASLTAATPAPTGDQEPTAAAARALDSRINRPFDPGTLGASGKPSPAATPPPTTDTPPTPPAPPEATKPVAPGVTFADAVSAPPAPLPFLYESKNPAFSIRFPAQPELSRYDRDAFPPDAYTAFIEDPATGETFYLLVMPRPGDKLREPKAIFDWWDQDDKEQSPTYTRIRETFPPAIAGTKAVRHCIEQDAAARKTLCVTEYVSETHYWRVSYSAPGLHREMPARGEAFMKSFQLGQR